jgi:hypothetical protein
MKTTKRKDRNFHSNTEPTDAGHGVDDKLFNWGVDEECHVRGNLVFFLKYTLPVLRKYEKMHMTWGDIKKQFFTSSNLLLERSK